MNDDSDKTFVNRHGHTIGGNLEATPTPEPFTPPPSAKPAKIKKVRGKRQVKKPLLITLVVLVVVLLIPVIGGELVRARYLATRDNARSQLIEFATKTVVPEQKKTMKLSQLSDAASRVEAIRDHACDGGFSDNLAMLYPRAKHAYDECIAFKGKVADIASSLHDMESQVRYLESLTPALAPVAKDASDEFAIISAQHENWRAFYDVLSKLSPAAPQRAIHDALVSQTKGIVDAWSALNTANDNQDTDGFATAEKKLDEAYETFRSSSAGLSNVMNATQAKLTAAYEAL